MKKLISTLCVFYVSIFSLESADKQAPSVSICLNMIVKDESPVIQRCLSSVKPFIDTWVIVDTGSSDDTKKVIRECMKDIPGELHERPWVSFGHNRNEALQLAKGKGDYVLFIDADEILSYSTLPDKTSLTLDAYVAPVRLPGGSNIIFKRALLINNHLNWSWKGVIHEKLDVDKLSSFDTLSGVEIRADTLDGHRAQDPKKYLKDAAVLEKALIEEPENADYVYYLAQSYFNAGEYEKSLQNYLKRAEMAGWDQHTFHAMHSAAELQEKLGSPVDQIISSYCKAYQFRPSRIEPLYCLAKYLNNKKNHILSYALLKQVFPSTVSTDMVYVEPLVYQYGIPFELALAAQGLRKFEEAETLFEHILKEENTPDYIREVVRSRLALNAELKKN
jgi:glycosyltransferase involved in cell wall biosynthesis